MYLTVEHTLPLGLAVLNYLARCHLVCHTWKNGCNNAPSLWCLIVWLCDLQQPTDITQLEFHQITSAFHRKVKRQSSFYCLLVLSLDSPHNTHQMYL